MKQYNRIADEILTLDTFPERFSHALDTFHAKGYQTELGPNCYEGCGIGISNTPEKCGQRYRSGSCGFQLQSGQTDPA